MSCMLMRVVLYYCVVVYCLSFVVVYLGVFGVVACGWGVPDVLLMLLFCGSC